MKQDVLYNMTLGLTFFGAILLISALFYLSTGVPAWEFVENGESEAVVKRQKPMFPEEHYDRIGSPALSLEQKEWEIRLPDLRHAILYQGVNGRPDLVVEKTLLHFSLVQDKSRAYVTEGKPLYLFYNRQETPAHWTFSPENEKTPLWIAGKRVGDLVKVIVGMENEKGELVSEPKQLHQFSLHEKELPRAQAVKNWEIGKWRVDGTLLGRQRAKWYGKDRFFEDHGGDEYQETLGKHRVDFGEGEAIYSVFVEQGDSLVWIDDRWVVVEPGEASKGKPLMLTKRMDDRLLTFELWDVEGKGKINLNLLKSSEAWLPGELKKHFKFIASRTKTQFVFEIRGKRTHLSPNDWLIFVDGGWKKLATEEEIDDYVSRKIVGPLFIFDGFQKKEERQVLQGQFYNQTRTVKEEFEIPILQSHLQKGAGTLNKERKVPQRMSRRFEEIIDFDDDEDEDDEEDDEEIFFPAK